MPCALLVSNDRMIDHWRSLSSCRRMLILLRLKEQNIIRIAMRVTFMSRGRRDLGRDLNLTEGLDQGLWRYG